MNDKEVIEKIYEECTYWTGLSAGDLNSMPEQYEHGKIDGIHNTAYAILRIIEENAAENAN